MRLWSKLCLVALASIFTISATQAQSSKNNFSLEIPPVEGYQLAKAQFLPDLEGSEWGYNTHTISGGKLKIDTDTCSGYALSTCPANGTCSRCPTNSSKLRLLSCKDPYIITDDKMSCRPKVCSDFGAEYKSAPGSNEVCYERSLASTTKLECYFDCEQKVTCSQLHSTYLSSLPLKQLCFRLSIKYSDLQSLTCYSDCRDVSNGLIRYPLNCSSKPEHATSLEEELTCKGNLVYGNRGDPTRPSKGTITSQSDAINCGSNYCRIKSCEDGYKANSDKTKCLNDTCPNGYYKECETGTQGDPQYTESGTACYRCKAPGSRCVELGYNNSIQWRAKKPNDGQDYELVQTATCPYASNYWMGYWNPTTCKSPKPGYYLYSDLTCSNQLISAKTVIGIIFSDPSVTSRRLAVNLKSSNEEWKDVGSTWIDTSRADEWSNVATSAFWIDNLTDHASPLEVDNGKANTKVIYTYCKGLGASCPAAEVAYEYSTAGTSAGDWYLPSTGELKWLFDNKTAVNKSLSSIGSSSLYETCYIWSSEERLQSEAWVWYEQDKTFVSTYKGNIYCSYAVLDLDQIGKEPSCSMVPILINSYPLTSCPAHGKCTPSAGQSTNCKQTVRFKLDSCEDGYTKSGNTCVSESASCNPISCVGEPTPPANALTVNKCLPVNADCTFGSILYAATSCKSGYTLSFGRCIASSGSSGCEGYTLSSCPAHASCLTCFDISGTKYKIKSCDSGYYNTGKSCVYGTLPGVGGTLKPGFGL